MLENIEADKSGTLSWHPSAVCQGPGKTVWPASATRPHLHPEEQSGWFDLVLCVDCGTLCVQSPYEPHALFIYLVAWPYTREFWHFVSGLQNGRILSRWCACSLRRAWPTMSEQDRQAVEFHRVRNFVRNPVEVPKGPDNDPLEPYLATPAQA